MQKWIKNVTTFNNLRWTQNIQNGTHLTSIFTQLVYLKFCAFFTQREMKMENGK